MKRLSDISEREAVTRIALWFIGRRWCAGTRGVA